MKASNCLLGALLAAAMVPAVLTAASPAAGRAGPAARRRGPDNLDPTAGSYVGRIVLAAMCDVFDIDEKLNIAPQPRLRTRRRRMQTVTIKLRGREIP